MWHEVIGPRGTPQTPRLWTHSPGTTDVAISRAGGGEAGLPPATGLLLAGAVARLMSAHRDQKGGQVAARRHREPDLSAFPNTHSSGGGARQDRCAHRASEQASRASRVDMRVGVSLYLSDTCLCRHVTTRFFP